MLSPRCSFPTGFLMMLLTFGVFPVFPFRTGDETASAAVERRSTSLLESRCRAYSVALGACECNVACKAANSGLESYPQSERASPSLVPHHQLTSHERLESCERFLVRASKPTPP